MVSLQPSSLAPEDAELPSFTEITNTEQHLQKYPTDRVILWEELPKTTPVKFPTDETIQWEELPKVTREETIMIPDTAISPGVLSAASGNNDKSKTEAEAGMADVTLRPLSKQTNEVQTFMDSKSTWEKRSEEEEAEVAARLKGHADVVELRATLFSEQFVSHTSQPEFKQSSLSDHCPVLTNIPGMPSLSPTKDVTPLLQDPKPILERQSEMKGMKHFASKEDELNKKEMILLVPSCPSETRNPGFPSVPPKNQVFHELKMLDLSPCCPSSSIIPGSPSKHEANIRSWVSGYEPLLEKEMRNKPAAMTASQQEEGDSKPMMALVGTCSKHSSITGIPSMTRDPEEKTMNLSSSFPEISAPEPIMTTDMVSLLNFCTKSSQILGCLSYDNVKEWTHNTEPVFKPRLEGRQVSLADGRHRDESTRKAMVSLVPSCPKEAQVSGFPSCPNPTTLYFAPDMISLSTSCSQVSRLSGFPSVDGDVSLGWITNKDSLLKKKPKTGLVFEMTNYNTKMMKNMVSCVPSCPKHSSVPGFPSIPNPRSLYYGPNVVNLFPLCPSVSDIPGFPSIEGTKDGGWSAEPGSLVHRPLQSVQFRLSSWPFSRDKLDNMHALVPSCPRASHITGVPSIPRYSMLSILPVSPKVSSFPGLPSCEGASDLSWSFTPQVYGDRPLKEKVFMMYTLNQDLTNMKTMLAFTSSCPEASKIPGFPSAPQTKPRRDLDMLSFVACCPKASALKGFASMTANPSTWSLSEARTILMQNQEKKAEMFAPHASQDQLYGSTVPLVASCPKEARSPGFPSAPVFNRPPDMLSLFTPAPCVSWIQGLPSARMLSYERSDIQSRVTHRKTLLESLQRERTSFLAKHEHAQDDVKNMAAMAPSCPQRAGSPGFPSVSQLDPTKKETETGSLPYSVEERSSQDLHHVESDLEDVGYMKAPSTLRETPPNGETELTLRLLSFFCSLFQFVHLIFMLL